MILDRRNFLAGALAATVSLSPARALSAGQPQRTSAPEVLDAALKGKVVLVDIRSREEWRQTGLAGPAHAISMHEGGFMQKLMAALEGDRTRPVALICAQGVRSRYVQHALAGVGFTNVIDVSEGMVGSPAGPGWLKRGLPVKPFTPE